MSRAARAVPAAGLLATLFLALPAFSPWLDPRLDLFRVDDARLHMVRLYHLGWLIERGVLYPRWVPDMFLGYGYPLLNFYGPAFYALALALKWLTHADVWDAYRYAGVAIALWGTAGAYAMALGVWRRLPTAIFAGLTMAYGPYVFQLNLWGRAALPEALALSFLPWVLLATHRLWHTPSADRWGRLRWGAALAITGTLLWLSHNLTAVAAFAVTGLWTLAHLVGQRRSRTTRSLGPLLPVATALALSLGLSSFFWLPAIGESRLVQLEAFQSMSNLDWSGWLVEPTGITDKDQHPDNRQTRYGWIDRNLHYPHQLVATPKISLAQAGLGLLSLGVLVGAWLGRLASDRLALMASVMAVALVCWLLTFTVSAPLWEHLPFLATFQHPWRLLGPGSIALTIAAAGALATLAGAAERRWGQRGRVVGFTMSALATAAVLFNSLGARQPPLAAEPKRQIDARFIVLDEAQDFIAAGTTGVREFLPREVQVAEYTHGMPRHVNVFERLYPELEWLGGLLLPLEGDLRVLGWRAQPLRISARVANDAQSSARLGVRQLRFAGWRAWIDGMRVPIDVAGPVPEQQTSAGFMVVEVPPGEHTVDLAFGPSTLRLAALFLTLASTAAGAALLVRLGGTDTRRKVPLLAAAALGMVLVGYGGWRAARPALGRFAALPVPAHQRAPEGDAWQARDLAAERTGAGLLLNVAEAARTGRAHISSPTGATLGPEQFVDVRYLTVTDADALRGQAGTSRRQWLYLHPPSSVSVDVSLPPLGAKRRLWLQTALALDPATWNTPTGDGVHFTATVVAMPDTGIPLPGAPTTVLDRTLNPRAAVEHRRFVPVVADLSQWAGRTVRLTLATDPRDDTSFDWAGFATPVVALLDTARDPLARQSIGQP